MKNIYTVDIPPHLKTVPEIFQWVSGFATSHIEVTFNEDRTKVIVTTYQDGVFTPPAGEQ